jgi:hypothetical protein
MVIPIFRRNKGEDFEIFLSKYKKASDNYKMNLFL